MNNGTSGRATQSWRFLFFKGFAENLQITPRGTRFLPESVSLSNIKLAGDSWLKKQIYSEFWCGSCTSLDSAIERFRICQKLEHENEARLPLECRNIGNVTLQAFRRHESNSSLYDRSQMRLRLLAAMVLHI